MPFDVPKFVFELNFDLLWTAGENYVYQNGCRAQPWRQLNGDICYLVIKCFDVDQPLYVTANTSGYYLNRVR